MIDARKLGSMKTRTHRQFSDEDIERISGSYQAWLSDEEASYKAEPGFSRSVSLDQIHIQNYALVPGRYVGFSDADRPKFDRSTLNEDLEAVNLTLEDFKKKSISAVERLGVLING